MANEQEIKALVIARLETLPEGKEISIGGDKGLSKEELIKHVEQGDEIGRKMIEIEMSFLRGLKEGFFYGEPDHIDNQA